MTSSTFMPLKQLHALNSSDIGLLLEGLKSAQGAETNLAKLSDFDNVLTILESSFNANDQPTWLSSISPYENLKIPPKDILRVVYSLAARPQNSNWSDAATLVMGLKTSDDYTKEQSLEYNMDPTKSPMNDRATRILNEYVRLLQPTNAPTDSNLDVLYDHLCTVMNDFCVSMYVTQHHDRASRKLDTGPLLKASAALKSVPIKTPRLRASKRKTPLDASPTKQSLITSFFEPSPVKKRVKPNDDPAEECQSTDEDELDFDIVSDSDRQECSPISHLNTDMELEIRKFQQHGSTDSFSQRNTQGTDAQPPAQMSESELFFKSMTSANTRNVSPPPDVLKPEASPTFNSKNHGYAFKVFDEIPFSHAMNPTINHRFTIWRLINFTFYCADRSSLAKTIDYNSPYHTLFLAYKGVIDMTIDFLALNLVRGTNLLIPTHNTIGKGRDCLEMLSHQQIALSKNCLNSTTILFLALLSQLGPFSHDWYDRIVEFSFNGLGSSDRNPPKVCYKRDSSFISSYSAPKNAIKKSSANVTSCDNTLSMTTRHKISLVAYYYSLFYDDSPDNARSSTSFIGLVGKRLQSVNHHLIRTLLTCDDLPACIRHHGVYFSIRLAGKLLAALMPEIFKSTFKFVGAMSSKEATADKQNIDVRNLATILSVITESKIYPDPDTFDSSESWKDGWQRFNMLIEWLFSSILRITFENQLQNHALLRIIQEGCQRADRLRNSLINHHSTDAATIKKLSTPGPLLKASCYEGLVSFKDIFLTVTGIDSSLFQINWEQEYSPKQVLNCI